MKEHPLAPGKPTALMTRGAGRRARTSLRSSPDHPLRFTITCTPRAFTCQAPRTRHMCDVPYADTSRVSRPGRTPVTFLP